MFRNSNNHASRMVLNIENGVTGNGVSAVAFGLARTRLYTPKRKQRRVVRRKPSPSGRVGIKYAPGVDQAGEPGGTISLRF